MNDSERTRAALRAEDGMWEAFAAEERIKQEMRRTPMNDTERTPVAEDAVEAAAKAIRESSEGKALLDVVDQWMKQCGFDTDHIVNRDTSLTGMARAALAAAAPHGDLDDDIATLACDFIAANEHVKKVWVANGRRGASQEAADLVNRAGEEANRAYDSLLEAVARARKEQGDE